MRLMLCLYAMDKSACQKIISFLLDGVHQSVSMLLVYQTKYIFLLFAENEFTSELVHMI